MKVQGLGVQGLGFRVEVPTQDRIVFWLCCLGAFGIGIMCFLLPPPLPQKKTKQKKSTKYQFLGFKFMFMITQVPRNVGFQGPGPGRVPGFAEFRASRFRIYGSRIYQACKTSMGCRA